MNFPYRFSPSRPDPERPPGIERWSLRSRGTPLFDVVETLAGLTFVVSALLYVVAIPIEPSLADSGWVSRFFRLTLGFLLVTASGIRIRREFDRFPEGPEGWGFNSRSAFRSGFEAASIPLLILSAAYIFGNSTIGLRAALLAVGMFVFGVLFRGEVTRTTRAPKHPTPTEDES